MIKIFLQNLFHKAGYEVKKFPSSYDPITEEDFKKIAAKLKGIHAQSWERLYALYKALHYVVSHKIPGDIVECGVYRGATAIMAASILNQLKQFDRKIYLYDTFEGMSAATNADVHIESGKSAKQILTMHGMKDWHEWINASLEEVQKNVWQTGYPKENFVFVKGKVEDTLPGTMPSQIALLRLDTDWYESTYHELVHLYPKLSPNGILLLDDYGHWKGAKEAVDRYFSETKSRIFLQRIDYTGYIGVKT